MDCDCHRCTPRRCPSFPRRKIFLKTPSPGFYALRVKNYNQKLDFQKGANLELRDISDAGHEYPVKSLCSTYIPAENRIRDSLVKGGAPVLTFASVLKYDRFPLAQLITDLMKIGREGLGCDVEFEFCLDLKPENDGPDEFYILQVRPMTAGQEHADIHVDSTDISKAFCYSTQCLGNGLNTGISDIVYVRPDTFDPAVTQAIADEIGVLNARLKKEARKYLLAGPGRWGSADRWPWYPGKVA